MKSLRNSDPKRAVVFAPFFSAEIGTNRPFSVACVLAQMAAVDVITTDFDHSIKKKREKTQVTPIHRIIYLSTLPYRSNVGIARFLSHVMFSIRAAMYFLKHRSEYDIVYVTLPLNVLAWLVLSNARSQLKIVDVIDIWPDVLPFPRRLVEICRPLFALWRRLFNKAVAKADIMLAVSDTFFHETLKYVNTRCHNRRFYIGGLELRGMAAKEDTLTIAYVGNIGRLYDFETLLDVMVERGKGSIQLFIVGEGDRREWLLNELKQRGLPYRYYGVIYDPVELGNILCRAHIGYNGFVNTSASFSYKATTYLAAGLPILNSMTGDLENLVVQHGLGLNYKGGDRATLKRCFLQLNESELKSMSKNCSRFFAQELERGKVHEDMLSFLRDFL